MNYLRVCKWEDFQHYKKTDDDRPPKWIKAYPDLLRRDSYMELTGNRRAILHGLWLLYAVKRRLVADNPAMISRELNLRVVRRDIEALVHAGYVEVCSRESLEEVYSDSRAEREVEKEKEHASMLDPPTPLALVHAEERPGVLELEKDDAVGRLLAALGKQAPSSEQRVIERCAPLHAFQIHAVRISMLEAKQRGDIRTSPVQYVMAALKNEAA